MRRRRSDETRVYETRKRLVRSHSPAATAGVSRVTVADKRDKEPVSHNPFLSLSLSLVRHAGRTERAGPLPLLLLAKEGQREAADENGRKTLVS